MVEKQYFKTDEAVEFLNDLGVPVTRSTFEKHKRGDLPTYKIAGWNVYKKEDLLRWLERRQVNVGVCNEQK